MSLGANIQYLRKLNKLTQEQFAEKMDITRQTVSRWEADEVTPKLSKLVEIIRKVPAFKMARYVMISPNPESDVQNHMRNQGKVSGLLAADPNAKLIGWDFPFVSQELQSRFGLHGYVAAYILPEGYKYIMDFLQANNFKDKVNDDIISCFEYEYEKEGVHYMDIYVHAASVTKVDAYSVFN